MPQQPELNERQLDVSASPHAAEELHDQIATRAYELYEQREREGGGGDELSDWLRAESEVLAAHRTPASEQTAAVAAGAARESSVS